LPIVEAEAIAAHSKAAEHSAETDNNSSNSSKVAATASLAQSQVSLEPASVVMAEEITSAVMAIGGDNEEEGSSSSLPLHLHSGANPQTPSHSQGSSSQSLDSL